MATSRTGTAKYLRNAAKVKRDAQRNGLTHCPGVDQPCGVELDYTTPLLPQSAEADHIDQHRHGGSDDLDNLRVICRACNQRRNRRTPVTIGTPDYYPTSRAW